MSTISPDLLREVALTVELGKQLTLIIVFGPGYLANHGLAEIREAVRPSGSVVRHRLDQLGPNIAETIASAGEARPIVLVSGLERMTAERREQVLTSINLLRDTLNKQPAVIIMWTPTDIADDFRRLCVDLFHWRALTLHIEENEHDERRIRHDYLVSLMTAWLWSPVSVGPTERRDLPMRATAELQVRIAGEDNPQSVDTWLDNTQRGVLLGSPGSGKTTALCRHAALRAIDVLDEVRVELPVFVAARDLNQRPVTWHILARAVVPTPREDVHAWLAQQLASAPALLLIDGLDEVPGFQRDVIDDLFLPLAASNPRLRIILATRSDLVLTTPYESALMSGWERAEVLPLSPATSAAWLREFGLDPASILDTLVWANAQALIENPLSLQFVAEHAGRCGHGQEIDLTALIGEVVDFRLGRWDRGRLIHQRSPESHARILEQLTALAVSAAPTTPGETRSLRFVAERAQIVQVSGSSYSFTYQMYHDYFTGRWLATRAPTPERLAESAALPGWCIPTMHALRLLRPRERQRGAEKIWEASSNEVSYTRWSMRMLVLRATLADRDRALRVRFVQRAKAALQQAQRDAEPDSAWLPVAKLIERVDEP